MTMMCFWKTQNLRTSDGRLIEMGWFVTDDDRVLHKMYAYTSGKRFAFQVARVMAVTDAVCLSWFKISPEVSSLRITLMTSRVSHEYPFPMSEI